MEFLHELDLSGTSIKELPSSIDNLKGLERLFLSEFSPEKLPSSSGILTLLQELRLEDGFTDLESIDKVTPKNSEAGNRLWEALKVLTLKRCCLSETNFFRNNYFPALERLDLSGSDIVIFPPQGVRFDRLRYLTLSRCDELEEILPLPLSLERVEARRCTSLGSFALLSEIPYGINNIKWIDLYGCHKLFANKMMSPIPSQSRIFLHNRSRQPRAYLPKVREIDINFKQVSMQIFIAQPPQAYLPKVGDIDIIFPGKRIPSWFNHRMEVYSDDDNSIEHEIDINPPQSWTDIDGFVFYVAFGDDATSNEIYVNVTVHDGLDWKDLYDEQIVGLGSPCSSHVWMHWMSYDRQVNVSRLRFRCSDYINERLVLGSVGIHFLKKHEKRPSSIWELENDDENPKSSKGRSGFRA